MTQKGYKSKTYCKGSDGKGWRGKNKQFLAWINRHIYKSHGDKEYTMIG